MEGFKNNDITGKFGQLWKDAGLISYWCICIHTHTHTHTTVGLKCTVYISFLKILFIHFYRERRREGEKHHCVAASWAPPTGALTGN